MTTITPTALRVRHRLYGPGWFHRLLETPGHARVQFDIDDGVERRVLVRDLAPERGERPVEDREVPS